MNKKKKYLIRLLTQEAALGNVEKFQELSKGVDYSPDFFLKYAISNGRVDMSEFLLPKSKNPQISRISRMIKSSKCYIRLIEDMDEKKHPHLYKKRSIIINRISTFIIDRGQSDRFIKLLKLVDSDKKKEIINQAKDHVKDLSTENRKKIHQVLMMYEREKILESLI